MNIVSHIKAFLKDEEGASAIEYALLAALIGLAIVSTLPGVGTALKGVFDKIKTALTTAA
ncbi:MAG: Flp family type IVb pilin [Burkholderiales bacterium]|nr:Flp family type IVb pilin [Burkholderiales bacterium]MBH2015250.1 Flp family type IVb pilin [Burkholderiales bacterium]